MEVCSEESSLPTTITEASVFQMGKSDEAPALVVHADHMNHVSDNIGTQVTDMHVCASHEDSITTAPNISKEESYPASDLHHVTSETGHICESANTANIQPTLTALSKEHDCNFQLSSLCSMELRTGTFFKGCKWAPDGLCLLSCSSDNMLRLFNTPREVLEKKWREFPSDTVLKSCLNVKEAEVIYDYTWWPHMNSMHPETCCFVSTAKDQPIHLWDAFNGELRASYIAKDHLDEVSAAHSLGFSPDGLQLICGFAKYLRLFYIDKPGTSCETWPTRKHKKATGQRGIISTCEFSPDGATIACGSYDGSVGLYSARNGDLLGLLHAESKGVTQVRFSSDGNRLYSGSRMDGNIICWDVRYMSHALFHMARKVETNQRIYFDIATRSSLEQDGKPEEILVSGNTDGSVLFWNTTDILNSDAEKIDAANIQTCLKYQAHRDCVNGVSIHPFLPVLATSSGQRHYESFSCDDLTDSDSSVDKELEENCLALMHISNWNK